MAGGFLMHRGQPIVVPSGLAPSVQWGVTGVAGSGFGGANPAAPSDPARLTAKPWCAPLFAYWDTITSNVILMADVGAKGGLSYVRFWLEGNYVDATEGLVSYTDINGVAQSIWCWSVTVDYATWIALSASGTARLYIEAVPANPLMQTRVMGDGTTTPYILLYARTSRFTDVLQVPSVSYPTLSDAVQYAFANYPAKRCGIEIQSAGSYAPPAAATAFHATDHWTVIYGKAGLSAGSVIIGDGTHTTFDSKASGIAYEGAAISFRPGEIGAYLTNAYTIASSTALDDGRIWFNGCDVQTGTPNTSLGGSGSGANALSYGCYPQNNWLNNGGGSNVWNIFYTDVSAHDLCSYGIASAKLFRKGSLTRVSGSGIEGMSKGCALNGIAISDIGGFVNSGLAVPVNVGTITGPAGSSFERTGINGNTGYFVGYEGTTAVVSITGTTLTTGSTLSAGQIISGAGVAQGTRIVSGSGGTYTVSVNYSTPVTGVTVQVSAWTQALTGFNVSPITNSYRISDLVTTVNSTWTGWNIDTAGGDTRMAASCLTIAGLGNSNPIPRTPVGAGVLLKEVVDVHAGAISWGGSFENVALRDLVISNLMTCGYQDITSGSTRKDIACINIASQDTSVANGFTAENAYMQGNDSHVVRQCETQINTSMYFSQTYKVDAYCVFDHCSYGDLMSGLQIKGTLSGGALAVTQYPSAFTTLAVGDYVPCVSGTNGTVVNSIDSVDHYTLSNPESTSSTIFLIQGIMDLRYLSYQFMSARNSTFWSTYLNGSDAHSVYQANAANSTMYTSADATPPDFTPKSPLLLSDGNYAGCYDAAGHVQRLPLPA